MLSESGRMLPCAVECDSEVLTASSTAVGGFWNWKRSEQTDISPASGRRKEFSNVSSGHTVGVKDDLPLRVQANLRQFDADLSLTGRLHAHVTVRM